MDPKRAKAVVAMVQRVVGFADPLGLAEPDHLGEAAHGYDEVAASAAAILLRGGSAREAVSQMQATFRADWGTTMSIRKKCQLTRRLHRYVVRELLAP